MQGVSCETSKFVYPVHVDPQVSWHTPVLRPRYFQLLSYYALQSTPFVKMGTACFVTMEIAILTNCTDKQNPRRCTVH